ncbi:hypothetical protein [Rhizobacter fulvus]
MTYQSYMIGQDDPQPIPDAMAHPQSQHRIGGTVSVVTTIDGVVTETTRGQDRGNTGELHPYHGTDSLLASARHPLGLPLYQIEATTLLEVNGVQAPVSFWVKEGVLQKNQDGSFTEAASRPMAAAQADTSGFHPIADHQMAIVNAALGDVDQGNLDGLASVAMGVAVGRLDASALSHKFSQVSGHDGEQGSGRLESIRAVYQQQADSAITSRYGIAAEDRGAFYSWAKQNMQGQLQEAVMKQMHYADVTGYKAIAARWLSVTPPSDAALKAAGHPVRMQGGQREVFVAGQWMRPEAAARMSML